MTRHFIRLGAGVQSTTMALMALHEEIKPLPEAAIFADTQGEPSAVYDHLEWLRGVVIENRDAMEVMAQHDGPETLHYLDPPYVPETRVSNGAYEHEMTAEDHERLAEALHELRGAVVLSGYRCALYDRLFSGWRSLDRAARADGARARTETLWLSPRAEAAAGLFAGDTYRECE